MKVSYFSSVKTVTPSFDCDLLIIFEMTKNGTYKSISSKIRKVKNKQERQKLKAEIAPGFTPSGTFTIRNSNNLVKHSGGIALDIDDVENLSELKDKICKNKYTLACFVSISGNGLCVIIKIPPSKHLESFYALEEYFFNTYGISIDPSCKDVTRFRFVSDDPDLYHNPNSLVFEEVKKEVVLPKQIKYLHTHNKFERILNEIKTDISSDYQIWVQLGFAIISEYGEAGRDYFHRISSLSSKYSFMECDSKYTSLLKSKGTGVTIATFYYYAKLAGCNISTPREQENELAAYLAKTQGRNKESVGTALKAKGVEPNPEIIDKVFESEDFNPLESNKKGGRIVIEEVEQWLTFAYDIRKNEITRNYEMDGKVLEHENLNTIYLTANKMFHKLSRQLWDTILYSELIPSYNPIKEYLQGLKWDGEERISLLASSITSSTFTDEYKVRFLLKWLLGLVNSAINGEPNILMLILAGQKQGTGKSTFFKKLLPEPLREYFAASQLDDGKDDKILLTQKLLILDDEYSGKSRKDSKQMKYLLSANQFDLREPYGKKNVRLNKLASLGATTNDVQILNDPSGNRRIIIFEVSGICNFDAYNKCDKEQLFAEIVHRLKMGERCELTPCDLKVLNENTSLEYSEISTEKELLLKYFAPVEKGEKACQLLTATDIKVYIENATNQRLYHKKLGMELKANGFIRYKIGGVYKYAVIELLPQYEE
jgi:hypothetical protein